MIAYLCAIVVLSWAGSKEFEGHGYLGYGWDQLCVAVTALVFCYWGVRSGWHTPALAEVQALEARDLTAAARERAPSA